MGSNIHPGESQGLRFMLHARFGIIVLKMQKLYWLENKGEMNYNLLK
jgi:hypothetical protein